MSRSAILLIAGICFAGPWENPLLMARSSDGIRFEPPERFQDSSGVPSAIVKNGDTLVCAFQWCRAPKGGPTWDRVAVKFSYDRGVSWTEPELIVISGLPQQHQRPFDPTLVRVEPDSVRIYFSSSKGMPPPGGDSIIDTYSAVGTDGVHYQFEPGARVDHPTRRVIDPAVVRFRDTWHYASPIGAPQDGAYHFVSPDGLHFSRAPDIPSDPTHNWTGNFVVGDTNDLRFYGCGPEIWFNTSPDGGTWLGYTSTGVRGGDPTVARLDSDDYLMIFVGQPYAGNGERAAGGESGTAAGPTVVRGLLFLSRDTGPGTRSELPGNSFMSRAALLDISGRRVMELRAGPNEVSRVAPGIYFLRPHGRRVYCRILITG